MVMGDDSCLRGRGFNPGTVYWMDIFTLICCENGIVCLKKTKNKQKRGRD